MTIASVPLTILADDREKAPYTFDGLGDVHVIRRRLVTGDYSLPFLEDRVAVSRKSLADLYATLLDSARLERFVGELRRMSRMDALVVAEENPYAAATPPGAWTSHVLRSRRLLLDRLRQLQLDCPAVRWEWPTTEEVAGRRFGEVATLAFLMGAREKIGRRDGE